MSSRENEARFLHENEVNLRDRETKWPPTSIANLPKTIREEQKNLIIRKYLKISHD